MFQMQNEMLRETKTNVRGGSGSPDFVHLFSAQQLSHRAELAAIITLHPGDSVGAHPHEVDGEIYCVLQGAALVSEDGVERELRPGDAEFCADGHTHAIRNHTNEDMCFLALVVPNR